MNLNDLSSILQEVFDNKKAAPGTVKFSTSSLTDPHIQKAIQYIASESGRSTQDIINIINDKVAKMTDTAKLVPSLYKTMLQNAIESEVFNLMWQGLPDDSEAGQARAMFGQDANIPVGNTPINLKFSDRILAELVRCIKADHDEFFPLRGFVDRRPLLQESWVITPSDNPAYKQFNNITTAAATPTGIFLFHRTFCQKLLDYAELKGIQGNSNKYISKGGKIPDQYAYLEFLIIHELMHFSNDDFYYQHIIPNANPTIINWVGDFRSNYLLVKSGYAQLPMGLYNDSINYDRQSEYVQMYNIVKSEMEKLPEQQQKQVTKSMNGQTDDHGPGQAEGKAQPGEAGQKSSGDIDKNAERVEKDVEKSNNVKDSKDAPSAGQGDPGADNDQGGQGSKNANVEIDYSQVAPAFNWSQIAKRFVGSATPKMQETYAKPHRRGATSADLIAQTGAGAVKPAEKITDHVDITLMFVVDSSGSMSSAIAKAYSNIVALLKQPVFRKSECIIARFSSNYDLHKGCFATNKAATVTSVNEKPKVYNTSVQAVFNSHMGYSTNFHGQLVEEIMGAIKMKYNVLIFSDSDIFSGQKNIASLQALIKAAPRQVFVLFDKRETYVQYRSTPGSVATPNISHL